MGAIANNFLVGFLVVFAIVISLGLAGVGTGEFHQGIVVEKLLIGDTPHFLVNESNVTNTLVEVKSFGEYLNTEIGTEISWERPWKITRYLCHVSCGSFPGNNGIFCHCLGRLEHLLEWLAQ